MVVIEKNIFTGKKRISWDDVEQYLKKFSGKVYTVKEYNDRIHIGSNFAKEYCGSQYTKKLYRNIAKVKANLAQKMDEVISDATNRRWVENKDHKHSRDAKYGWYRYDIFFSMPVSENGFDSQKEYRATMVVKINDNGKYLYDIVDIKKRSRTPFESED